MTDTRYQNYINEEETARCKDVATISVKYTGTNPILRTKKQIENNKPSNVECYFSADDDVWYARVPAVTDKDDKVITPASQWVRAKTSNLQGLMEA